MFVNVRLRVSLTFCACLLWHAVVAQQPVSNVTSEAGFRANPTQKFGFDRPIYLEWNSHYETWIAEDKTNRLFAYKSVGFQQQDVVDFNWSGLRIGRVDQLRFRIQGSNVAVASEWKSDSLYRLILPPASTDYVVQACVADEVVAQLKVLVYPENVVILNLVPLVTGAVDTDSIAESLNRTFKQANIRFHVVLKPVFSDPDIDAQQLLNDPFPNHDRFTQEMHDIRDVYLRKFPHTNQQEFTFFLVSGFHSSGINGYGVSNKSLGFVKSQSNRKMAAALAKQLGFGIGRLKQTWENNGPKQGTTDNLMDQSKGKQLRWDQWQSLRLKVTEYRFFDDFEEIKTNIGIVAYYFWEEDALGNIQLKGKNPLDAILRPYKKNTFSYHLQIDDFYYVPLFTVFEREISTIHVFSVIGCVALFWWLGKRTRLFLKQRFKHSGMFRFASRMLQWILVVVCSWYALALADWGYSFYEVTSGEVTELEGNSLNLAVQKLSYNVHPRKLAEKQLTSEILVKQHKYFTLKQRRKVIYFDAYLNAHDQLEKLRMVGDMDSIHLLSSQQRIPVESHYLVIRYKNESGKLQYEKVFNQVGFDLTDKLNASDPPKRIVLFVNGYRPTSLGRSFEDNFADVRSNGLEFPNSFNHVYSTDQYNYWHPWNAIDDFFKQRLDPTESYYVDGHFSVATSNHRSLLNFTTLSARYPKRCMKKGKHVCYYTTSVGSKFFGKKRVKTISLHRTRPNKKGFNYRRENGKIAGRNLLQVLNELPNTSANDTLFIVAHSMGFAYSLGIVDELRGHIQFGSYYIIAPENASVGLVNPKEWTQVWQYGSDFPKEAPCLQDGVAPQIAVGGLNSAHRVYIPAKNYYRKGFFDSHFIGYYTWIFQLKPWEKGYILPK